MNLRMAAGRPACSREMVAAAHFRVTLKTQPLRVSYKIIGVTPVNEMASQASFATGGLVNIMVIGKRPFFVPVAFEAQFIRFIPELPLEFS